MNIAAVADFAKGVALAEARKDPFTCPQVMFLNGTVVQVDDEDPEIYNPAFRTHTNRGPLKAQQDMSGELGAMIRRAFGKLAQWPRSKRNYPDRAFPVANWNESLEMSLFAVQGSQGRVDVYNVVYVKCPRERYNDSHTQKAIELADNAMANDLAAPEVVAVFLPETLEVWKQRAGTHFQLCSIPRGPPAVSVADSPEAQKVIKMLNRAMANVMNLYGAAAQEYVDPGGKVDQEALDKALTAVTHNPTEVTDDE